MTRNLLIIMSDEHQARAMGCAGHPFVQTPNLDAFAEKGVRFTNACTPCPICVPARAAFATGKHVHQVGYWDNAIAYDGAVPGWGHQLQRAGVPVESIGKLHYRSQEDPAGFDVEHIPMMISDGVGLVWASIRREDERITQDQRMLGERIGPGDSSYTKYDRAVVSACRSWFKQRASNADDRPWCLFVGLVAPHFPLVVPPEYFDLYPPEQFGDVKLHPDAGHGRHPWVEKQNEIMDNEGSFHDEEERLAAFAAYYGLCTSLDHNIGQILAALKETGLEKQTSVVYTSDHGENLGARGFWGKSTFYRESVDIPLIVADPGLGTGECHTPVSLIDLSATIAGFFGQELDSPGKSLLEIASSPTDSERVVFSEYHAVGAVSGGFMIRRGRWKYHHYVGFEPELFDLDNDPEELVDLAQSPEHAAILSQMHEALLEICDPDEVDARAFRDQAALIERLGGRDVALGIGLPGATPAPKTE